LNEPVDVIALIAERKIAEAMAEGRFDHLPGAGRPLPPDELDLLPAECRLAMRILRNSGLEPGQASPGLGPALPPSSEAGRLSRSMTRLELAMAKRPGHGRRPGPGAGNGAPPGAAPAILDSPYLAKTLERLGQ
jgi:hypothetical protein